MAKLNADLATALDTPAADLKFLEKLKAPAQQQLVADIAEARNRHSEHIKHALDDALNQVPRLIRGPLKKIFGA